MVAVANFQSCLGCRFKCRAHAAEIAAAQARTTYIPEGPPAEEEAGQDASNARQTKRQRTNGTGASCSSHEYWDCFFKKTRPKVKRQHRQVEDIDADLDGDLDEEEDVAAGWGFCSSDSDCGDFAYDESESDDEYGTDRQQEPGYFYKQAPALLSPAAAFQQLVQLLGRLPKSVMDDTAAAHLKGFESRKVRSACCAEPA